MAPFRALLLVLPVAVVGYTVPVVMNHGLTLFPVFFGDIQKMEWPGQFNMDFMGFLVLSGLWMAWRHHWSPAGLALAVCGFFGGIPMLTSYLLFHSFQANDMKSLLLGPQRAAD